MNRIKNPFRSHREWCERRGVAGFMPELKTVSQRVAKVAPEFKRLSIDEIRFELSRARHFHYKAAKTAREHLEYVRKSGEHLLNVKKGVSYGEFGKWLKKGKGFPASQRTADYYMVIAEHWDELPHHDLALTYRKAIKFLTKEKEPSAKKLNQTADRLMKDVVVPYLFADWPPKAKRWFGRQTLNLKLQNKFEEILSVASQMLLQEVQQEMREEVQL
jgi:hypothetical protein